MLQTNGKLVPCSISYVQSSSESRGAHFISASHHATLKAALEP